MEKIKKKQSNKVTNDDQADQKPKSQKSQPKELIKQAESRNNRKAKTILQVFGLQTKLEIDLSSFDLLRNCRENVFRRLFDKLQAPSIAHKTNENKLTFPSGVANLLWR